MKMPTLNPIAVIDSIEKTTASLTRGRHDLGKKVALNKKIKGDGQQAVVRRSTRRLVLQMGYACNARCSFCYYLGSIKAGTTRDYSTEEVKSKLREAKSLGLDQVDLSGGEPTIRPDLAEVISYARDLGFVKIAIITNGIRMANPEYVDMLVAAGLNDILLSTHGTTQEEHDGLTNVKGSFDRIRKATQNIARHPEVELRFNATITSVNYGSLDALFDMLHDYDPTEVNLLVFNGSQDAKTESPEEMRTVSTQVIGDAIQAALTKHRDDFRIINVRWIPFCMVKGHEASVQTMWQKMYEDKEWDPYLNIKYNKGTMAVLASALAGVFLYPFLAPRYGQRSLYTKLNEALSSFRGMIYYKRLEPCRRCQLRKICPGVSRANLGTVQAKDLQPYTEGELVRDPLHFSRKEKFTSLRL